MNHQSILNQHEGENEKLYDKIKLLETENKILKDDIATKQKLIVGHTIMFSWEMPSKNIFLLILLW